MRSISLWGMLILTGLYRGANGRTSEIYAVCGRSCRWKGRVIRYGKIRPHRGEQPTGGSNATGTGGRTVDVTCREIPLPCARRL
jgi:hypothetical protein